MSTTATKQNLIQSIEKNGWHLNNEFIDDLLQEKPNTNLNDLIKVSLDSDLKEIGRKHIPEGIMNGKCDCLEGPCVLQITKVRNIATPKDSEHTASSTNSGIPAFFKLTLTDGVSNCTGLVMEDINRLNMDTPPGTKLLLKGNIKAKMSSLLLNNQTCEVLGGHVEPLVNKWRINKDLSQHVRTGNSLEGAPPPWVPFGSKQQQQTNIDTTKKTLKQQINVEDSSSEFSQARQAALAEAVQKQLTITKKFTQQNVVPPQQASASAVPATTIDTRPNTVPQTREPYKPKGAGSTRAPRGRNDDDKSESGPSKPSQLTLFDVLKSKLPELKENEQTQQSQSNDNTTKDTTNTITTTTETDTQSSSNQQQQQQQQQQYQSSNQKYQRYSQSNNDYQQKKERKSNLPPRLQRANEEQQQQQQRYSDNSINQNTNYQNNRRRGIGSGKYQNMNEINNNTQQPQQQYYNINDYSYNLPSSNKTDEQKQTNKPTTPQQTQPPPQQQQQQQNDNQQPQAQQPQPQPQQPQPQPQPQQQQQQFTNTTNDNNNYNNNQQQQQPYNKTSIKGNKPRYNNQSNPNPKYNPNINNRSNYNNRNNYQQQFDYDNNNNTNVNNTTATNNNTNPNQSNTSYNQYYYPSNRSYKQSNKNGYYMQQSSVITGTQQQQQIPVQSQQPTAAPVPTSVAGPYINFPIPFYYDTTGYYNANPNYPPLGPNGQPAPGATTVPVPGIPVTATYDQAAAAAAYYQILPLMPPPLAIPQVIPPPPPSSQPQQQQTPPPPPPSQQQQQDTQSQQQQQPQQYDKPIVINDNNNNISQNDSQIDNSNTNMNRNTRTWKVGDRCSAKYYDYKFYNAQIQHIEKGMCQVKYDGYDEIVNVKFSDLKSYREQNTQRNSHK